MLQKNKNNSDEINNIDNEKSEITDSTTTFTSWENLNINRNLLRGIYAIGFEQPSPIQQKTIIPMINKHDIIAQAQSGTGKTGCFTISALELTNINSDDAQVIIMAPTRELSFQIKSVVDQIGIYLKKLRTQLLIGGVSTDIDIKDLKEHKPQIIIGCPGRIHDMIRRKHIIATNITLIILDEADEMLSAGFKEQVYK